MKKGVTVSIVLGIAALAAGGIVAGVVASSKKKEKKTTTGDGAPRIYAWLEGGGRGWLDREEAVEVSKFVSAEDSKAKCDAFGPDKCNVIDILGGMAYYRPKVHPPIMWNKDKVIPLGNGSWYIE